MRHVPAVLLLFRLPTLAIAYLVRKGHHPTATRVCALAVAALYGFIVPVNSSGYDSRPDFIPVVSYADDVIVVAIVLRSAVRRAGFDAVRERWPGTPDGFVVLSRAAGLRPSDRR